MIEKIVALKRAGRTWAAIGAELGITQQTARGLYRRHSAKAVDPTTAEPSADLPPTPKGWERGAEITGNTGTISTGPVQESSPDFEALLRHLGFDPELFEVLEPVNVRTWESFLKDPDGQPKKVQLWYYKANIRRRRVGLYQSDVAELVNFIRSRGPLPEYEGPTGPEAFVFAPSDLQLGKSDGDGVKGTVARFRAALKAAVERMDDLDSIGRVFGEVVMPWMGDGNENTAGHYDMQSFSVELNRRDQIKLLRELGWEAIETLRGVAPFLHVTGVAGNHPENRNANGKAYTTFGDNDDLAVLDQWKMIAETVGLSDVGFTIPRDELELVIDACGTKLGIAHGHQMKAGSSIEARVKKWWEDQMLGRLPIGEADILLTGHNHHTIVKELNGRWWIQCPTLESRSDWARSTMGAPGCPGVLTFTTANGKWRDLQVL